MEWVLEYLEYSDGNLIWIKSDNPKVPIGAIAGCTRGDGYVVIRFKRKNYLAHRLIWFMHHGECPRLLDHRDRNPSNNKLGNLRPATKRTNSLNRNAPKNSRSGKAGVSWDSEQEKWAVRWKEEDGQYSFLGYFEDREEAIEIRLQKEKEVQNDS